MEAVCGSPGPAIHDHSDPASRTVSVATNTPTGGQVLGDLIQRHVPGSPVASPYGTKAAAPVLTVPKAGMFLPMPGVPAGADGRPLHPVAAPAAPPPQQTAVPAAPPPQPVKVQSVVSSDQETGSGGESCIDSDDPGYLARRCARTTTDEEHEILGRVVLGRSVREGDAMQREDANWTSMMNMQWRLSHPEFEPVVEDQDGDGFTSRYLEEAAAYQLQKAMGESLAAQHGVEEGRGTACRSESD